MKLNRTAKRTVDILKLVSDRPEGVTLDEICSCLKLPKTSAYDIVTTLAELGMLNITRGQRQSYTIGLAAYRIGVNYLNNMDFISAIEPELKAFCREVERTVFFGVRSDHEVVYICKFEPENPIITTATVGTKNPVYCTSLGKAILAFTDEESRSQILSRVKFERKTARTILSRLELTHELEEIRETGYAVDDREMEEHMKCVGAPVFGADGSVLGAISVSSLYKPEENYALLGQAVAKKAAQVSKLLGFLGKM